MWELWKSKSNRIQDSKELLMRKGSLYQSSFTGGPGDAGRGSSDLASAGSDTPRTRLRFQDLESTVNFKDLNVAMDDISDESDSERAPDAEGGAVEGSSQAGSPKARRRQVVQKHKLIIILVGLPGRGKTFLCNKLKCYLNWLGHRTNHFNVGTYRRKQNRSEEVQDASFFDSQNMSGLEARHMALLEALEDLEGFLTSDEGQIAIFDATNTTEERRNFLIQRFHGRWQYLFIESICNDEEVLEANYLAKMMYSPDYKGMDLADALADFKARIRKYEAVYETISNRNIHYIKLIDMVTGKGHMDINRISGYIPGKIVFYLMQVCKAGLSHRRKIWLSRHGESVYNTQGLLGGDSPLSPKGEAYANTIPDVLIERLPMTADEVPMPVSVWTSTLKRTCMTAEHLPFPKLRWKALDEIHAGICDGMTYKQIEQEMPHVAKARKADKLRYRYPSGESYLDVIQRLEPVIIEMERERECVCIVAHQAILRAIYGYFMNVPQDKIPSLSVPLHTLIELTPNPDGQMVEERISVPLPDLPPVAPPNDDEPSAMPCYPNVEDFPPQVFTIPKVATPKAAALPTLLDNCDLEEGSEGTGALRIQARHSASRDDVTSASI